MNRRRGECASTCHWHATRQDADRMVPSMRYHHLLTNLHEIVLPAILGPSSHQDTAVSALAFVGENRPIEIKYVEERTFIKYVDRCAM